MDKQSENAKMFVSRMRELLNEEELGGMRREDDPDVLIREYVLPALESSKNVLADLYHDIHGGSGPFARIKRIIITKVANISRNTMERSMISQQRYNDMVYTLLKYLYEKNSTSSPNKKK